MIGTEAVPTTNLDARLRSCNRKKKMANIRVTWSRAEEICPVRMSNTYLSFLLILLFFFPYGRELPLYELRIFYDLV